jgi:hypothetical protein
MFIWIYDLKIYWRLKSNLTRLHMNYRFQTIGHAGLQLSLSFYSNGHNWQYLKDMTIIKIDKDIVTLINVFKSDSSKQ